MNKLEIGIALGWVEKSLQVNKENTLSLLEGAWTMQLS